MLQVKTRIEIVKMVKMKEVKQVTRKGRYHTISESIVGGSVKRDPHVSMEIKNKTIIIELQFAKTIPNSHAH